MRHAGRPKVTVVVAALLMAAAFETPLRAGPVVAGDQRVWEEITAAFQKLEATSYRMRMSAPEQTVITEHVPPGSTRTTTWVTGEVGEIDSVTVGDETRSRVIGPGVLGSWVCGGVETRRLAIELKDYLRVVEASRLPDTLIEGLPVHTYAVAYTIRGSSQTATAKTIFYVGIQTGLPRRSITSYPLGSGGLVVDYYDYGAPITITLPACS